MNFCKLNTDASVVNGRVSGGGLVCDHRGNLVFAFYKELGEAEVLEAEIHALLFGLQLCSERNDQNLQVKVDSSLLFI